MRSTPITLCLLTSLFSQVSSVRPRAEEAVEAKGDNKCTISWTGNGWKENDQPSVSFGIGKKSCAMFCSATAHNYDTIFKTAFVAAYGWIGKNNRVSCQSKAKAGKAIFEYPVKYFGEMAEGADCWEKYKYKKTADLETTQGHQGKLAHIVKHRIEWMKEETFAYTCETGGCKDDGDCGASHLPGMMAGKTDETKNIVLNIIDRQRNGEFTTSEVSISKEMQELVDDAKQDKAGLAWEKAVQWTGQTDKTSLTVQEIKDFYEVELQYTGFGVETLLANGGFTDPAATVTEEQFKEKFYDLFKPCD